MENGKKTTIKVSVALKSMLDKIKRKDETYEQLLLRLLNNYLSKSSNNNTVVNVSCNVDKTAVELTKKKILHDLKQSEYTNDILKVLEASKDTLIKYKDDIDFIVDVYDILIKKINSKSIPREHILMIKDWSIRNLGFNILDYDIHIKWKEKYKNN